MSFVIDTGAAISTIPPRKRYKKYSIYYNPQNLIAAKGTLIRICGTKKLNIDLGARYTLSLIFKVANVDISIIGTNFLRRFDFAVDIINNYFILLNNSMYHRHYTQRTQLNYVNRISCASAISDVVELPPSSPSSIDVTNKFPLEPCAEHDVVCSVDATNAFSNFIHNSPRNAADPLASITLQFRPFFRSQRTLRYKATSNHAPFPVSHLFICLKLMF